MPLYTHLHRFILQSESHKLLVHGIHLFLFFYCGFRFFQVIFLNLRLNCIHLIESGLSKCFSFQGILFRSNVRLFHLCDLLHQGLIMPLLVTHLLHQVLIRFLSQLQLNLQLMQLLLTLPKLLLHLRILLYFIGVYLKLLYLLLLFLNLLLLLEVLSMQCFILRFHLPQFRLLGVDLRLHHLHIVTGRLAFVI